VPGGIETRNLPLDECAQAGDVVVVIDVLRAFSTEAVAFERGVSEIIPVSTVEEALRWKQRDPDVLLMGEVNGYRITGFDLWNSPGELLDVPLNSRRLVHRTSAGTQGLLCCTGAKLLQAASFLVASATARYLRQIAPERVDFIITGQSRGRDGDEDAACADYITSLLNDETPDPSRAEQRVRASTSGQRFLREDPSQGWLRDLELCLQIDCCNFAMHVTRRAGGWVVQKQDAPYL